jgi:electron transfer flavoprotein beta subunit
LAVVEVCAVKIAVCLKQTPAPDAPLHFDPKTGWLDERDCRFETGEADLHALEEALRLRDRHGGEVLALTLGPERGIYSLRDALARGSDRAIHVADEAVATTDPLLTATALADVLRPEGCDLILAGLQSDDQGFGQTGVMVAELLDLPHASIVTGVQCDGPEVQVQRETGAGWRQTVILPLPCVLTVQAGINRPRYASIKGIMAAKNRPVVRVTRQPRDEARCGQRTVRIVAPERDRPAVRLEGVADEVAYRLVALLAHGKRG